MNAAKVIDVGIQGRLGDVPYHNSPPVLFVYTQTAALVAGAYSFPAGAKAAFTPSRPINPNHLYLFQTLDFACDVDENDYMGAYTAALSLSVYVQSDAGAPAFREPIPLVKYYKTLPYILGILGTEMLGQAYQNNSGISPAQGFSYNRLQGNVIGAISQTAPLLGKSSITATCVFTVTEVSDKDFIADYVKRSQGEIGAQKI